jgi:CheY-like chemotaxis protein
MYNILIVDDDPIIAEIITNILWVYIKKHNIKLTTLTASNGQEALDICQSKDIDLVFMDINMPVMHGIDATREIRKLSSEIMIIALSSVKSELNQRKIIDAGADDYIKKPITAVIFESRLTSYIALLNAKNSNSLNVIAKNLFSFNIYNHNMTFFINSEDDLSNFWENILKKMTFLQNVQNVNDLVHVIFDLGMYYLQNQYKFEIYIEESKDNHYFTLSNAGLLPQKLLEKVIENNFSSAIYTYEKNKLSFLLTKEVVTVNEKVTAAVTPVENSEIEITHSVEKESYQVYNFLEHDDIEEFEDNLYKLNASLSVLNGRQCGAEDLNRICESLLKIKSILMHESESYTISTAIGDLLVTIQNNEQEFIENVQDLQSIALGFVDDLILWKEMTFYKGAPSIDFMNDSILANAKIMQDLLHPVEMSADELDSIFDF